MKLRNSSQFKIDFGTKLMSSSKLPTLIDIGKHYLYLLNHNYYGLININSVYQYQLMSVIWRYDNEILYIDAIIIKLVSLERL